MEKNLIRNPRNPRKRKKLNPKEAKRLLIRKTAKTRKIEKIIDEPLENPQVNRGPRKVLKSPNLTSCGTASYACGIQ